jgi:hypothetical protein
MQFPLPADAKKKSTLIDTCTKYEIYVLRSLSLASHGVVVMVNNSDLSYEPRFGLQLPGISSA